jgi:hypothetical protein
MVQTIDHITIVNDHARVKIKNKVKENLKKFGNSMLRNTRNKLPEAKVNDIVALKCHEADRGNSDPYNLLCVITDVDTEKVNYKLLSQVGPLEGWFFRNDFIIAKTVVFDWIDKVNPF